MYGRVWPCLCNLCRHGQFARCKNIALVGRFKKTIMKKKGTRVAKARFVADEPGKVPEDEWAVTKVHGKCFL